MRTAARRSSQAGISVVETMIVLAIGGLIMMIVFQAVPALQRTNRNSQRKQDVATILRRVNNYELNNSGNFPDSTTNDAAKSFLSGAILTYYDDASNVVLVNNGPQTTGDASGIATTSATNAHKVYVYNYYRCDDNTVGSANRIGAGYSDVVALYMIESGDSGRTALCQQL